MNRLTLLFSVLVGIGLAVSVPLSDNGVPRHVATGARFLPPALAGHSTAGARGPRSLSTFGIDSFPSPDTTPFGLAWDGANLWNVDLRAGEIFALDPVSGSVRRSFSAPDQWSKGLCFDGQNLWVTGNYQSRIYKIDTVSGSVLLNLPAPGSNPAGLAFDGTYLWCADINSDQSKPSFIFKLNPANGARLDSLEAPCRMVADMDWDGTRVWVCDMDNPIAYGLDPATGEVKKASGTPGPMPTGIAFRNGLLVNSDWARKQIYTYHPDSGPAAITLEKPAQWDVLPTWRSPTVIGTVVGLGLDSFRVEYGVGEHPTQWIAAGATQTSPAYRDTLATWDVSGITQPGKYCLRVKAFFGSTVDTNRVNLLGIDPQIATGWPKTFANVSPVACADISGDTGLEVMAGTDHQNGFLNALAAWHYDGSGVAGFPVSGISVCQMPVATGDVNRDDRNEIASGFDLNHSEVNLVYGNGTVMSNWPQDGGHPGSLYYMGIPVLADVNGDSLLEAFSGGGLLSGWDTAANPLTGWPKSAEYSSPAVADFDRDGVPELVALRKDSVYMFKANGGVVAGWPVGFGGAGGATFPVVGDINGDDRLEIAFTIGNRLFCINDSGRTLSGFPKTLSGTYANSPVLGDVDRDGMAEIVVVSGSFPSFSTVNLVRYDGSSPSGWPKTLSGQVFRQFNAPVLGDITEDGYPEILMGFEGVNDGFELLYAWDWQGTVLADWPKLLRDIYGYGITGSPVLADMDDDGELDCAISSNAYWMYNTDIYVWDLGVALVPAHQPWPVYRHDPQMTGAYVRLQSGVEQGRTPGAARREPEATIARGVLRLAPASSRKPQATSWLLDISGRRVMNLRPGPNDVTSLQAGVYFVRDEQSARHTRVVLVK